MRQSAIPGRAYEYEPREYGSELHRWIRMGLTRCPESAAKQARQLGKREVEERVLSSCFKLFCQTASEIRLDLRATKWPKMIGCGRRFGRCAPNMRLSFSNSSGSVRVKKSLSARPSGNPCAASVFSGRPGENSPGFSARSVVGSVTIT